MNLNQKLNKPLVEYNKSEIKELVVLIKGPLKGRISRENQQNKINELNERFNLIISNENLSQQLIDNMEQILNYMEETIIKQRTFSTGLIVLNVFNQINYGQNIQNQVDNILDKYARG